MILGCVGNTVVVYIFSCKWKVCKTVVFILTLAFLDIFNCGFNMTVEAAILWDILSFDHVALCKVSRFATYTVSAAYSFVLVAIAVDRYLLVCRPFKGMRLDITYARRTCVFAVILALFTQWPSLLFYGTMTYRIPILEVGANVYVEGKTCLVSNYYLENKTIPAVFNIFLFCGHIIIFLLLITLYILIGRKLFFASGVSAAAHVNKLSLNSASIVSAITGVSSSRRLFRAKSAENNKPRQQDALQTNDRRYRYSAPVVINSQVDDDYPNIEGEQLAPYSKHAPRNICNNVKFYEEKPDRRNLELELGLCKQTISQNKTALSTSNGPSRSKSHSNIFNRVATPTASISTSAIDSVATTPGDAVTQDLAMPLVRKHASCDCILNVSCNKFRKMSDIKESSLRQNTVIMRMVTVTFILSYLPFLVIVTLRYSNPDKIPGKLSKPALVAYHIFLRSYFINSVTRPFIYVFMNEEFRQKVTALFLSCIRCILARN